MHHYDKHIHGTYAHMKLSKKNKITSIYFFNGKLVLLKGVKWIPQLKGQTTMDNS